MRVLAYIASVILSTALLFGGALLLIAVAGDDIGLPELLLSILPLTAFIYGPLMLGSLAAYWNFNASPGSRSYFRRWIWPIVGVEVLGAIAFIVFTVLTASPVWVAVLFIGGAAVLLGAAVLIGRALLRREKARQPEGVAWAPITRDQLRRNIGRMGLTFVIALVVVGIGLIVLHAVLGDRLSFGFVALTAVELALLASAIGGLIFSLRIARQLRDLAGGDAGLLRTFAKVVLRRKSAELTEPQQTGAAKYAATMKVFLPFQISYIAILYVGILLGQVSTLLFTRHPSELALPTIVFLVVVLLAVLPNTIIRTRRARAYAAQHADLLPATSATTGQ